MKTPVAIAEVTKIIKGLGFSVKGTCLYRTSRDERVIQTVFVQPGRTHLAGKFTIAMGSFLPTTYQLRRSQTPPQFPDISKCQIVSRLSSFAGAGDIWWDSNSSETAGELAPSIQSEIPRFFEQWGEVAAILGSWRAGGALHLSRVRVSEFAIAALLHEEHMDAEAQLVLENMYTSLQGTGKDIVLIKEFANKLGIALNV